MTMRTVPISLAPNTSDQHLSIQDLVTVPHGALSSDSSLTPIQIVLDYKWRILAFAGVLTAIAALIIWSIPPVYTASAAVTIDARQMRMISPEQLLANQMLDELQVRTLMEEIASIRLARSVVANISLNKVPEYCLEAKQSWSWREWFKRLINPGLTMPQQGSCEVSIDQAAEQLLRNVSVNNDGKSYIIRIQATGGTAALAATLANAYADAYVADRFTKRKKIVEEAANWLHTYVDKLSGQVVAAETAVAQYRSAHNLISLRGETLVSQSLVELNSQLSSLNVEIAKKQSLLSQLGPAWSGGLSKEVASLNERKALMMAQLHDLQTRISQQGDEDVHLQELLQSAESSRQIYQAALTRIKEIEIDGGIARSDAQIVSTAAIPRTPSYPLKTMMLVGAFLSSLGLGTGLALALGLQSNLFRDERHLESETGQPMLGIFPRSPNDGTPERIAINHPLSLEAECLYRVLTEVLDASPKGKSDSGKIVLLTSAAPNEGKTSYSLALGLAASRMGLSTVVLDCDMWNPALVAMMHGLEPHPATSELYETSPSRDYDEAAIGRGLLIDHTTGLNVLPLSVESRESPYIALGSSAMRRLLQTLRRKYDLILLDTPPLMARVDALPLACLADKVILLVDQQHTPRGAVIKVIEMLRRQGAPTTGVVFSKVNLRKYGRVNGSHLYSAKYSG